MRPRTVARVTAAGSREKPSRGRFATYSYDALNRLVVVQLPGGATTSYEYYADQRRASKLSTSSTLSYTYDGSRLLEVYDSGNLVKSLVYGSGAGRVLVYRDETIGEDYALSEDVLGSTCALTDDTGAVVERYEYNAYGEVTMYDELGMEIVAGESAKGNPILFAGYLYEEDLGHYWLQFRVYDPETGRFLQVDPLGVWGDSLNIGNGYGYAGFNPVNAGDFHGLFWDELLDAAELVVDVAKTLVNAKEANRQFDEFEREAAKPRRETDQAKADRAFAKGQGATAKMDESFRDVEIDVVAAAAPGLAAGALKKVAGKFTKKAAKATEEGLEAGLDIGKHSDEAAGGLAKKCSPSGLCFVAGTPIATQTGSAPIEDIVVGDRVLTDESDEGCTKVDPSTWSLVRLVMRNPESPDDVLEIAVLRSPRWMLAKGVRVGGFIDFRLDEWALSGVAYVLAVEPCPSIASGAGRVVLATVSHWNGNVVVLGLEDGFTLCPTARHRLYSIESNGWVAADTIEEGDRLRTRAGSQAIVTVNRLSGVHRVFNLEVETDHCYFAGRSEVLSHNDSECVHAPNGGGGGSSVGGGGGGGGGDSVGRTSRAARRDAMRQNNTPTSRTTTEQTGTGGRRQTVVEGSDGKPRVQTQHPADSNHAKPHWHDGKPKVDPDTGKPIRNRHGQIKDQNEGRSTSEYDG